MTSTKITPPNPDSRFRVHRGGSWDDNGPSEARAASRDTYEPAYRNDIIGFRCALRGREPRR